jgi:GT2 family glycosyltransferase
LAVVDLPDSASSQEGRSSVTAPRVQIVVVAHDPGVWFDEVLSSFAAQDYPRFSTTVLLADGDETLERQITAVIPDADVVHVHAQGGYGRTANEMLSDASSPAFYMFCHDDVALSPDALRLLVEEAIRSNVSVVGPKLVDWDHPEQLLDVGLDVDKLGHPTSRVEVGELDQEQHDSVTDVFAIPGAVQLVRADLFHALEGFDSAMGVTGEDVDFCWRAHVSGARVMVVPSAVVRHREGMGDRRQTDEVERLRQRHQVRTLLSVYGTMHSIRVVPQGLLYSLLRAVGSLLTGHFGRSRSAVGAWVWNLTKPASLLRRRRLLRQNRKVADGEIRRLQVRGFAPVTKFLRGQFSQEGAGTIAVRSHNLLRALRSGPSRVSMGFWLLTLVMLGFGSRHLITRHVPVVGELVPFDLGPGELFGRWFDSWWSTGTGHEAAAPSAYAITGALGAVLFGSMGLLRTVMTVGMLPIGAIGMWRFLRPFSSPWIRAIGTMMYLASPVPYNALGNGSWSALLMFGSLPWVLAGLGRAGRIAPFGRLGGASGEGVLEPSWAREVLALGLVLGGLVAFVPFAAVIVIALVACLVVGSILAGWPGGAGRLSAIGLGGLGVAVALNLPWFVDAALGEPDWDWFGGTRPTSPEVPDLDVLMRFGTGSVGDGPLGWALPLAGIIPLLLARGPRWAWAVRGLVMYLASVGAVWAVGNGWVSLAIPRPEVILVVGSLGLAVSAAMGVAAIEGDLRTYKFGWRQMAPVTAVVAVVLAVLPVSAAAFNGAWRMPTDEFNRQFALEVSTDTAQRVLWIGHDDVLTVGGRQFNDGVTLSTSPSLVAGFGDFWASTTEPADPLLAEAVQLALDGGTSRLGRLLAPFAIGEIVVLEQLAPAPAVGLVKPVPDGFLTTLGEQLDLEQVEVTPGISRYRNTAQLSQASVVPEGFTSGRDLRAFARTRDEIVAGGLVATDSRRSRFVGPVTVDDEIYLSAPASTNWRLEVDGQVASRGPALSWASAFQPIVNGEAVLVHQTDFGHRAMMVGQALLWLLAAIGLMRLNTRAREQR